LGHQFLQVHRLEQLVSRAVKDAQELVAHLSRHAGDHDQRDVLCLLVAFQLLAYLVTVHVRQLHVQ